MAKLRGLTADVVAPERYGAPRPEHLLICWGSTYGPCREAVDLLVEKGAAVAMLHFSQVWPLDAAAVRTFIRSTGAKRITCVEGNATGQFASMLREAGVLDDCGLILRYDGLPFAGEEIAARITR